MATLSDFPARGKVSAVRDGGVSFFPNDTSYELHLATARPFAGALNVPVRALIRASARKVWTVPSGGLFVTPIFGPPRIIQGRVRLIQGETLVVHAGTDFVIELPSEDLAIDLANGGLKVGDMVNCTIQPGASFELVETASKSPATAAR